MTHTNENWIKLIGRKPSQCAGLTQANAFEEGAPDPLPIRIGQFDEGIT
jgi:hypothetical protein